MTTELVKTERDSFGDVDRILTIVEESKAIYNEERKRFSTTTFRFFSALLVFILSFLGVYISNQLRSIEPIYQDTSIQLLTGLKSFSILIGLVFFSITLLFALIGRNQFSQYNSTRKEYKQTALQAADVLRETIPILANSENWSPLRRFELKLRLSRLGISEWDRTTEKPYMPPINPYVPSADPVNLF